MSKISELPEATSLADDDWLTAVDRSNTSNNPTGENVKIQKSYLDSPLKIIETITNITAGEFDFNNIPGIYKRLYIKGYVESDVVDTNDVLHVYFNEELTDTNYHYNEYYLSATAAAGQGSALPRAGVIAGSTAVQGTTPVEILMENYTGSDLKGITAETTWTNTATTFRKYFSTVYHDTLTAAVTRLRVRSDNHPTDQLLGTLTLYGEM